MRDDRLGRTALNSEYIAYLRSDKWKHTRRDALARAGYRCQRCGIAQSALTTPLEVHHASYEHLGFERDYELEVVCRDCHPRADADRARETDDRVWWRRVNAWARKKYGDGWDDCMDPGDVSDEFAAWLERRGEN